MEGIKGVASFLLLLVSLFVPFHVSFALSERSTYIVHVDKSVLPKAFISHPQWYSSMIDAAKTNSLDKKPNQPQLLYTYDNVLHGFSALLSKDELESLKKSPGFLAAYQDQIATRDTTHSPEFLSLNPTTGLWPASNYGEDVIVALFDDGVWPESSSFKDDGMTPIPSKWKGTCEGGEGFNSSLCNLKLIGARFFYNGFLARNPNTTLKLDTARDYSGHGTHLASIVAGNYVEDASFFGYALGTAKGVAPRARVAMYKVFWNKTGYFSDIIAAMDQAVADGVDVISLSVGLSSPFYDDPFAIASFGAMEKGVLVSGSAGNEGPHLGTIHNAIPWTVTVAAGTLDRWLSGTLLLANGVNITGWSLYPDRATDENLPLIYNKTISGCNSSELLSNAHGIVICDDINAFSHQESITESNVSAVIFFSDDVGIYDQSTDFPNPVVIISSKFQEDIIHYASNGVNPSARIKFQQTILGTKPAPVVADYSSRGPSPIYPNILKPDLLAPGTLVLAAWIPNSPIARIGENIGLTSDFNLQTGTSIASPHVSGIAALLKGAHPEWSPAAIRSAMMTTADALDNTRYPIKDMSLNYDMASPLAMGAGHVNPNNALDPGLIYDATTQDYINLLCSMNLTHTKMSTITRSTSYDCSSPSSDLNYPSFIALYNNGSSVEVLDKTFQRTLTNVGYGAATYIAIVTAPSDFIVEVNPQKLVFQEVYDMQTFTLTIRYVGDKNGKVSFGSLTWVDVEGKHFVRSPIVVSPTVTMSA